MKDSDEKKPLVTHLLMREMERRKIRPAGLGQIVGAVLAGGVDGAGAQSVVDASASGATAGSRDAA